MNTVLRALPAIVLAVAYPLLAHWASIDGGGVSASLAMADLVALCLVGPLMQGQAWAWAVMAATGAGLAWIAQTPHAQMLLLAPPTRAVLRAFLLRRLRHRVEVRHYHPYQ